MSSSRERVPKVITPLAAAIGGAAVGFFVRDRKTRQHDQLAYRFIVSANARADRAEEKAKEAQEESGIDSLTLLCNRRGFQKAYIELVARPNQEKGQHSLVALDLDNFKQVNDGEGGHAAGNEVLRTVAAILMETSRPGDAVARIGGDEMALILPRADATAAAAVAQRARTAIEATGQVTASFGVAKIDPRISMEENLKSADAALYAVKHGDRNGVATFSP